MEDIRESVDEAKKPGVFKIVDVLKERSYPKMQVRVSVDEQAAYDANAIKEKINKLDEKISKGGKVDGLIKEQEELSEKRDGAIESLKESSFTFYLTGISEGHREKLYRKAVGKYPIEHDREMDLASGKMEKVEKTNPDRDALYTDFLWEASIEKIINGTGDEQVGVSYTDVRTMREQMPLSAIARINDSIEKLRVSSAVFMMEVDEDFLAKSSPGTTTDS
jgi:ribosomal protein L6P/L9E